MGKARDILACCLQRPMSSAKQSATGPTSAARSEIKGQPGREEHGHTARQAHLHARHVDTRREVAHAQTHSPWGRDEGKPKEARAMRCPSV